MQAFRGKIKLQSQPNLGTYLVFFDLLALNGTNLMAFPLSYRYEKLIDVLFLDHSCRLPDMKRICIPPEKSEWSLKTFLDLKLMFLDVINNGGEGLMIKGLNSPYEAGSRDHWMKLKPDYVLGNGECHEYAVVGAGWDPTLDYVKVDFNECHGMNTFFIGCITNKSEVQLLNAKPHVLICFTVQTGFGRKDLVDFSAKMQSKRVLAEKSSTISSFTWTMSLSAKMLYFFHDPATFTIQGSSYEWKRNYWVVRHPRLVRECTLDRPWKEHSTTFQEMQLFGKTARAPTCFEIHELDKVISKYDNEYLKTGKITKDIRPLSKTDPASSRDYFESKAEGLKTSTFHIRYEQIDEIEDGAVLDLDKIWVFHFNVRDSSPLYRKIIKSPDALFLIAGWNCEGQNCDAQHEDIAIFSLQCEAEKICKQIESIIETIPKSAICIHSKALYILDAAYLTTERTNLNSQFILAQYSLY